MLNHSQSSFANLINSIVSVVYVAFNSLIVRAGRRSDACVGVLVFIERAFEDCLKWLLNLKTTALDVVVLLAAIALRRLILFVHAYFTLGLVGVMVGDVEILVIVRFEKLLRLGLPSVLSLIKV